MAKTARPLWRIILICGLIFGLQPAAAKHGDRVIILATDYPPFDIASPEDGLHGFDHEVAAEAFARRGITPEITYVPWSRAISDGENGHVQAVLTCAQTEERRDHFLFSDPISGEAYGIHYRVGFPVDEIATLADLEGYTVASVLEYATNADLKDYGADLVDISSDIAGFRMLELERVDFLYTGQAVGKYLLKRSNPSVELAFKPFVEWDYYLCFSKKHPDAEKLRQMFNEGLAEIRADGTYDSIHARYQ